jgi:hypothetical protein
MEQRSAQTTTRTTGVEIGTHHTDPAVIATRVGEALYARSHPHHQLSEPARQYAHMSFMDLARDCLRRSGVSVQSLSADTIISRAMHTTSDHPLIVGKAVGREMQRAYEAAPSGASQLARQNRKSRLPPKAQDHVGRDPES